VSVTRKEKARAEKLGSQSSGRRPKRRKCGEERSKQSSEANELRKNRDRGEFSRRGEEDVPNQRESKIGEPGSWAMARRAKLSGGGGGGHHKEKSDKSVGTRG